MQDISHVQAYHNFTSHSQHLADHRFCDNYYDNTNTQHPAIKYALEKQGIPLQALLMAQQQPVLAEDGIRIAFYPNAEKEAKCLHTVTTVGKYLRRFWPLFLDHELRDIAALFGPDSIHILDDLDDMVDAVQKGPYSCMKWAERGDGSQREYGYEGKGFTSAHPYQVYCPSLGWRLVVRRQGDSVAGRAVINVDQKVFVRSYAVSVKDNGYSETDQKIEAYLLDAGYRKRSAWPEGSKFLKVPFKRSTDFIVPFLDPGSTEISSQGRNLREEGAFLIRDNDGEIDADCVDGTYSENEDVSFCEDCNDRVDHDDTTSVGRYGDHSVCSCCANDNYTYVYGKGGDQYYIHNDSVVSACDNHYDDEYLSDNNIVQLHDGDYCDQDDTIYVESESEYYLCDDVGWREDTDCTVVEVCGRHSGEYELLDNCRWCHVLQEWHLEDGMTELADCWVTTTELADHLGQMEWPDVVQAYPDYEDYMPVWQEYQRVNNPAQFVLELQGA